MQMLFEVAVMGAALPAAVALALCLWARRALDDPARLRAAGALAIALGFAAGWIGLPWTELTVSSAWHWLPRLALAFGMVGLLADSLPPRALVAIRIGLAFFAAWCLVPAYPAIQENRAFWLAAAAFGVVMPWFALAGATRSTPPLALAIVLAVWALGSAALLERCAIAKFAQLAGVAAAALVPLLLLLRRPAALAGAVAPLCVLLPGLVLTGRFETFAPVPEVSFVLLLVVPLSVFATWRWWTPPAVATTLVVAGVGLAAAATL